MKKIVTFLSLTAIGMVTFAQPANDEPCNAMVLPIIESVDGCTPVVYHINGATFTNISGTYFCNSNPDIWLKFNTPDQLMKIRFGGTNVNFSTYTYSNCSSNLEDALGCIDSTLWSTMTNIGFINNTNQLVRISSNDGSSNFSFSICLTILRAGADQRVGVNTRFPQTNFDVAGKAVFRDTLSINNVFRFNNGTHGPNRVLKSDGNGYAFWGDPVINQWTTSGNNIYANNSGNIGIGNTNPTNKLSVTGNANFTGNIGIGNTTPSKPLSFPPSLGEKILLYPGGAGEVGIGVYANELRLHADNPGSKVSFGTQDNAGVFTENAFAQRNGAFAFSILGSLWVNGTTYTSDERFKQNIKPISAALEKLLQINGVEYEMKTTEFVKNHFNPGRQIGLLAQNVEKVVPEAVNEKDGYKGVDYARLVPLLIEAIRELKNEIEILKNKH